MLRWASIAGMAALVAGCSPAPDDAAVGRWAAANPDLARKVVTAAIGECIAPAGADAWKNRKVQRIFVDFFLKSVELHAKGGSQQQADLEIVTMFSDSITPLQGRDSTDFSLVLAYYAQNAASKRCAADKFLAAATTA